MKVVVTGEARPQGRPRISGRRAYLSKEDVQWRERIQAAAKAAIGSLAPMDGQVKVSVKIFKRFTPTARQFGDVDNHLKALLDGLSGICYHDDSHVVSVSAEKFQDKDNPRVEIELFEIAAKS